MRIQWMLFTSILTFGTMSFAYDTAAWKDNYVCQLKDSSILRDFGVQGAKRVELVILVNDSIRQNALAIRSFNGNDLVNESFILNYHGTIIRQRGHEIGLGMALSLLTEGNRYHELRFTQPDSKTKAGLKGTFYRVSKSKDANNVHSIDATTEVECRDMEK